MRVAAADFILVSRGGSINYSRVAENIEMKTTLAVALGSSALSVGKFDIYGSVCRAHPAGAGPAHGPGHVAGRVRSGHRRGVRITARGAHHTALSCDVTAEQTKDWADMMDIEFVNTSRDPKAESRRICFFQT